MQLLSIMVQKIADGREIDSNRKTNVNVTIKLIWYYVGIYPKSKTTEGLYDWKY